jgi:hypothetical protein
LNQFAKKFSSANTGAMNYRVMKGFAMKKRILGISIVLMTLLVLTLTQVSAAPLNGSTLDQAKKTPGAQATVNAEKWAAAHPDLVKGQDENSTQPFKRVNRKGEIISIEDGLLVITLRDDSLLTVIVTSDTILKVPGKKPATPVTINSLLEGMDVTVQGQLNVDGTLLANRVSVIPGKPDKSLHVGVVSAYIPDVSIEITNKKGEVFVYLLDVNTKFLPEGRITELAIGSLVTIISPRDVTSAPRLAAGVVIHPVGDTVAEEE